MSQIQEPVSGNATIIFRHLDSNPSILLSQYYLTPIMSHFMDDKLRLREDQIFCL